MHQNQNFSEFPLAQTSFKKCLLSGHSSTYQRLGKKNRGFTLLEIIMVVGIIAVLVGLAAHQLGDYLGWAKEGAVQANLVTISTQLKAYELMNSSLPTTEQGLEALVKKPAQEPIPERWRQLMEKIPLDPWNRPYVYVYPGKHDNKFDVYSKGQDGLPDTEDDIGNWQK